MLRARTLTPYGLLLALLAGFSMASAAERMALVIGNGQYAHSPYLNNPPRDAAAIAQALHNLGFTVTGPLRDQSKAQMEAALKDFGQRAQNATAAVDHLPAQVLLLVDTCHAGNIAGPWKQQALIDPDQFLRNAALNNVIVMASSSGQQVSLERADWGHGAFTKALLEGLQGNAADANGIVDLALLQRYVRQRVRTLTDGLQEPRIPRLTGGGEFLELVLAR
jgi:uncharacterized caspase-like protein